jgi:serine/threonine-protein kinase
VKILRSRSDERALNRFRRETRVIASLDSDHVVEVFDAGELPDGTPYLVMELLRGEDLRSLLREQPRLSVARAVQLVREASRGVAAAHRAGVIHRDLKPENLFLVRREGEEERCKVLDFGVAKTETSELTQTGTVIGTIKYMAPEQLEDSASVGPVTDVYALGVILYECLTGDTPFSGNTAHETMLKILTGPVRSVRDRRVDVPEELAQVVARALSRRIEERYQTSSELEKALRPFANYVAAPSASPPPNEAATADLSADLVAALPSFRPVARTPSTTASPSALRTVRGRSRVVWLSAAAGLSIACGVLWWAAARDASPEAALVDEQAGKPGSAQEPKREAPRAPALRGVGPVMPPPAVVRSEPAASPEQRAPASSANAPAAAAESPEKPVRGAAPSRRPRPAPAAARAPAKSEAPAGGLPSLRLDRDNPYGQ